MENATKALVIAGAILVAILLIAVGVRVLNSTKGTTESTKSTMKATEITMFNNKFTAYAGGGKTAAQVRALANVVIAHNATNPEHQVEFMGQTKAQAIESQLNNSNIVQANGNVIRLVYDSNGLVNSIKVNTTI